MKLEDKFFKLFFYPFFSSVILSSLIVILFIGLFTNNNYDKKTSQNIINLKKNYSKKIINSANILLTNKFLKFQISLNELALFYEKMANDLIISNKNPPLNNSYLKCVFNLGDEFCHNMPEGTEHMAIWLIDNETTEEKLDENKDAKRQLIAFSYIIKNLDSILETHKPQTNFLFFYFDITELYLAFPLKFECHDGWISNLKYHNYENTTCIDDKGRYYTSYKVRCETFFTTIMKSKTSSFDNNYLSDQNKSIYINNFFNTIDYENSGIIVDRTFDICIEFDDPITKGKGYACTNSPYEDIISSLDDFNHKLDGYFFVSNVGYNNVFYFPQGTITPKTSTENIYKWGIKYILNEKKYFHEHIRKIMSSNYNEYIGNSIYDEVFVNGKNSNEQFFYINEEKFNYSIYPIVLENLKGKKEHIMSLIYIYNNKLFFDEMNDYIGSIVINIIILLLLFIIFGSGLLYLVYLSFSLLAKYIVIPIQNVNYMLKGINIGGKNRLKYLNFLKRKQDENIEKLEKIYLSEINTKNIEKLVIKDNDVGINYNKDYNDNDFLMNKIGSKGNYYINEKDNDYSDFNEKYDDESNYIIKELNFYDYDEQLLQYRPLEIEHLFESLIDLKSAILLISQDGEPKQFLDYSYSNKIFQNYNNKEGAIICQSNIGNMQSQLLKYDKAIYHLALSLQDNKLKKFLAQNINDELDENDSLLKKISNYYNENKNKGKNNILVEKQMKNSKNNFSQKLIGILINIRYCRLIHSYYMFFKNMQKLQKSTEEIKSKQFMNTLFHTINYYHKILIQYIFLSYAKNDLVKIGESILNYLEFLIKFKFKTSSDKKYLFKISNRNNPEFRNKQIYKKQIFEKIMGWFNLFDDYVTYVKNNSLLLDTKCIVNDYSHGLNNEKFEFNLESQTSFMFRINIQKSNYLKGKFCLCCKNYIDALYYFICAAKKESLVIDGLIKKRSLKHIYKLLIKMNKQYQKFGLKKLDMEKKMKELENKVKINNKKTKKTRKSTGISRNIQDLKIITFEEEIERIKGDIFNDISECNSKQKKDVIVLIDFNIYNTKENNINIKTNIIDAFIEETNVILNEYLSINDRLCVLIYENDYKIICPLEYVNKIDKESFYEDLINIKNNYQTQRFGSEDFYEANDIEFNLEGSDNIHSQENSFEMSDDEEKNLDKIKGLIKAINYINNYLRMKEIKIDRYFILFTDMLNMSLTEEDPIKKITRKIRKDGNYIFLLVGKKKKTELNNRKNKCINEKILEESILNKFGIMSQIIYFENMKKIKTILSNNKAIKDNVFYPNEIYK